MILPMHSAALILAKAKALLMKAEADNHFRDNAEN
jgi:hypothetical protein